MKTTARCLLFGSRKQFFITTLVAALLLAAAPAMADTFNITVTAYTWYPREGLVTSSCTDTDTDGLAGVSVYCETSSPVGSVSASGGGNAYSGFLVVGNMDPGTPGAEVTLSLQGMYYLTGTGTGSIDFGEAFSTGCCSTDDVTMLFNGVSYQWSVVEG